LTKSKIEFKDQDIVVYHQEFKNYLYQLQNNPDQINKILSNELKNMDSIALQTC